MPTELFEIAETRAPETTLINPWAGQPRPDVLHPSVIAATVEKIYPKVKAWLEADGRWDEEEVKKELTKTFDTYDLDGYKLAKQLDDWNPDEEFVDIMGDVASIRYGIRDKVVRAWVEANQVLMDELIAKFPVGTRVTFRQSRHGEVRTGAIREVRSQDGQVTINETGKSSWPVINLEDLNLAE